MAGTACYALQVHLETRNELLLQKPEKCNLCGGRWIEASTAKWSISNWAKPRVGGGRSC